MLFPCSWRLRDELYNVENKIKILLAMYGFRRAQHQLLGIPPGHEDAVSFYGLAKNACGFKYHTEGTCQLFLWVPSGPSAEFDG